MQYIGQENNTKISVIMPAYNSANTIARAIDSVLDQSYSNWELMIVDDCSRDKTGEILVEYSRKYKNIHIIKNQKNSGVAASRNYGVREATGEWIAFLDSDDYWKKEKLKQQMKMLVKYPDMKLCYTGSAFVDEKGKYSKYILNVPERITFEELLCQNIISCSSVLVKKGMMLSNPMDSGKIVHEDFVTWLSILREIPYAVGVDEPLLVYQVSSGSKSGNKLKAAKMQWNSYRRAQISYVQTIKYMCIYFIRNIKKYCSIIYK